MKHNGFLLLPPEVRLQIYDHLFSTTRISAGTIITAQSSRKIKPRPNCLAILRTCRIIHHEARDLWIGKVTFAFGTIMDMLDTLTPLPDALVSQIRHVRVASTPLWTEWYAPADASDNSIPLGSKHFVWTLGLLPALRLDTLTVIDAEAPTSTGVGLRELLQFGTGWDELRFISRDTQLLAYARVVLMMSGAGLLDSSPTVWHWDLTSRDSGADLQIYLSTLRGTPGTVEDERTRRPFVENLSRLHEIDTFGESDERPLLRSEEEDREMMVVVRLSDENTLQEHPLRRMNLPWSKLREFCSIKTQVPGDCEDFYLAYLS
ncbi:hypothetical protein BDV18DRAFT_155261 [Aspergillus unguis]